MINIMALRKHRAEHSPDPVVIIRTGELARQGKWTPSQLARAAGIPYQTALNLSRAWTDEGDGRSQPDRIALNTLAHLCDTWGVGPDDVLFLAGLPDPNPRPVQVRQGDGQDVGAVGTSRIKVRVGELAEQRGWKARQLSEAALIPYQTALNLMRVQPDRVDLHTIGRVCRALNATPGTVLQLESLETAKPMSP